MTWWSLFIQTLYSCYTTSWDSTGAVVRAMDGIRQAKLANSAVQSLDLRLEALESGSLPEIALLQGRLSFVKSRFETAKSQLNPIIQVAPFLGCSRPR